MPNVLAALLVAAAVGAPAAAGFPVAPALPPVGVTVLVGPGVPPSLVSHILEEADALWRPIRFAWQRDTRLPTAIRLRIDDAPGAPHDAETPLGWVVFDGDIPEPEIHLSYANAYALLATSNEITGRMEMVPTLQRDTLLGFAMGRALAHELGHYLLASKAHSRTGLMQARRSAAELFGRDRSHFQVDDAQRVAVAARVAPPLNAAEADVRRRGPSRR